MRLRITLLLLVLFLSVEMLGRVGGGQSYSGGSSSSGSSSRSSSSSSSSSSGSSSYSGGDGEPGSIGSFFLALLYLLFVVVLFIKMLSWIVEKTQLTTAVFQYQTQSPGHEDGLGYVDQLRSFDQLLRFDQLRRFDPNFSQIVFEDFCYSLFAVVHRARGARELDRYAPYVSGPARELMTKHIPRGLTEVRDVIVGGMQITKVVCNEEPQVRVDVTYEANLTEVIDGVEMSWYLQERWNYERLRDILSPPPARAKAEHCPACGGSLTTRDDGKCEHCGRAVQGGTFNWYVRGVTVVSKSARGPVLTSNVEEQGTDFLTVLDPALEQRKLEFQAEHPGFRWDEMVARITEIAVGLQDAWTARDWERVRPLETEPLFQIHRYWIEAYIRQNLRNVVADFKIGSIDPVKIAQDAFYDAITVRLAASGRDHTIDADGNLVAGSLVNLRQWTEYWTLIRTRGTDADPAASVSCPNCGAAVIVGSTGICSFCSGKLTGGEFGWILSKIEQDEEYAG